MHRFLNTKGKTRFNRTYRNFSFFSNKNIATAEGYDYYNDDKLYNKFKLIRSHGMTSLSYQRFKGHAVKYDINKLGYNYRMDDLRASIGLVQLKKLKDDLNKDKY